MAQIEAKDIYHYVSTDDGVTFKTLICTTDASVSSSKSSTETDTRCGVLVSAGNDTTTFTGTAVTDDSPDANELSHNEMWALYLASTAFIIVQQNVSGTVLLIGRGEITDMSAQATQGQWYTWQYTIKISGGISQSHVS